jgi:protein SCO1
MSRTIGAAGILSFVACLAFSAPAAAEGRLDLPDVTLKDQRGRSLRFRTDVLGDHVVALQFVFTSCTTVCPLMGSQFGRLHSLLPDGRFRLVSISIDPETDTPQRLAAWGERFGSGEDWLLLTGNKEDVGSLQKACGLFTADVRSHSPTIVVVNGASGRFTRVSGLATAQAVADSMRALAQPPASSKTPAAGYFRDLVLTDQEGRTVDLYRDLMAGRVVVVQSFFTTCRAACPRTTKAFLELQERFASRLGRDLVLVSITVDQEQDTPAALRAYARQVGAHEGWRFLTGSRDEVDRVLRRFGQATPVPDGHSNLFLVGNDRTGLWKKLQGLAHGGAIGDAVAGVLDDPGPK